jgi:uncharacterized membrane protein (UPF0127 family)
MARSGAAVPRVARNETRASVLADHVAIAGSLWAKFWGLIGRRSLAAGEGLWLPHENGIHMFFMRFPIDAIFLGRPDSEGRHAVLSLHRDLKPWTGIVPLIRGAGGVLELPSGAIDASATELGDAIRFA